MAKPPESPPESPSEPPAPPGRRGRRESRPSRLPGAETDRALGGRVQRGASLARLSASTGAGFLTSKMRGLYDPDEADAAFHAATAEKLVELLGTMKGAAMKLGQIASFVDLDLPPEVQATYHAVLAELRDAAPPISSAQIAGVIAQEFGAAPGEVFAHWQDEPIASASIGQVHRARLPDGTDVVAKVQYPGVAAAVQSDLANAEAFAPMARLISPNLEIRPLMEELRLRLVDELDYQREAQYQHAFWERYDGHPFIHVPRVFPEYCRPQVLVTEYVEGWSFDEMLRRGTPEQLRAFGEVIFRFAFGSLHRFRLFNADPHPGNYLFRPDGTVTFLDFGSVKPFPTRIRALIHAQLDAVVAGDAQGLLEILEEAGFVPPRHSVDAGRLLAWFELFHRPVLADGEWTYTPEYAREVIRSTTDPRAGFVEVLRKLNLPPDYLLLNRIQWGVNSILGRLRATADWRAINRELRGAGPPASPLGEAEAAFIDQSPFKA